MLTLELKKNEVPKFLLSRGNLCLLFVYILPVFSYLYEYVYFS